MTEVNKEEPGMQYKKCGDACTCYSNGIGFPIKCKGAQYTLDQFKSDVREKVKGIITIQEEFEALVVKAQEFLGDDEEEAALFLMLQAKKLEKLA